MILAGGRGERLGTLTSHYPKSAVHFGGKHRIIDYTLSNCTRSRIDTVGILSQYLCDDLQAYIYGSYEGAPEHSDVYMLSPQNKRDPYRGTADAVYKNIEFIERFDPECVLILSGDHIYSMDYNEMIEFHKATGAAVTVASTQVTINEATRFGIFNADENGRVYGFEEKPKRPKSCLASMGIYAFKWSALKQYLLMDSVSILTKRDFGGDILPKMLRMGESIYTYRFDGYWQDVGTVSSLWQANMDLIDDPAARQIQDNEWISQVSYANNTPDFVASGAVVGQSIMAGECSILGDVEHSVLSDSVTVSRGAEVVNSVVMPGAYIGSNVKIYNAVIGTGSVILDSAEIGADNGLDFFVDRDICARDVSLVSPWACVAEGMVFQSGSHIYNQRLEEWLAGMDTKMDENRFSVHHGQHAFIHQMSVV